MNVPLSIQALWWKTYICHTCDSSMSICVCLTNFIFILLLLLLLNCPIVICYILWCQLLWLVGRGVIFCCALELTSCPTHIFVNILRATVHMHLSYVTNITLSIEEGHFPDELKLAEVSPIFKRWLKQEELRACQCSTSSVKGLWKNHALSNKRFHGK